MFTRCPKCKEVHPLTASVLSRSTGLVQCGRCNRIFNALSFLSDDWHASKTFKPEDSSGGELPVLGGRSKRNVRKVNAPNIATSSAADTAEPPADTASPTATPRRSNKKVWGIAALALLLLTAVNVSWTFRDSIMKQPAVHQWMLDKNWIEPEEPKGMLKNPAQIQLVSRDMHTHPTRTGILVLSVTFVNLAQQTQAFPVLRITLLDAGNQPIAQRRLQPTEYLRAGANVSAGLAPDVFLPILLELADPGEQAVGFEIEFL